MHPSDLPTHPISAEQSAVYRYNRRWPTSCVYHPSLAVLIRGKLICAALAASLARLAEHHEMLKASFHNGPRGPRAVEHPTTTCELHWNEQPDLSDTDLADLARAEVPQPFDLTRTAFRFVVAVGRDSSLLQLTALEIATDARSNWMLMRDLLKEYARHAGVRATPVHLDGGSYYAFAAAEARTLEKDGAVLRQWHRERLRDAVLAELPLDFDRPKRSAQVKQVENVILRGAEVDAVRAAAMSCEVTVYAFMLAGFQAFLSEATDSPDLVIGCIMSARTSPRMRHVIGYFANVMPIRARIGPTDTFAELARRASTDVGEGLKRVAFPFSHIVGEGILPRSREGLPACRVNFNYLGSAHPDPFLDALLRADPSSRVHLHGLDLAVVDLPVAGGAQTDLQVEVMQGSDQIIIVFSYDPEIFADVTMKRLSADYVETLRRAATDVNGPVTQR
jgi:hypothetical protein